MKLVILTIASWFFGLLSYKVNAQDDGIKKMEQINITKSGNKDVKFTIEFSGDKIMINGKSIMEFNEDGIVISNRKIITDEINDLFSRDDDPEKSFDTIMKFQKKKDLKKEKHSWV